MSEQTPLRYYDYVPRPYAAVRKVLVEHPADVFRRATTSAAHRSKNLAASLHTAFAGVDVGVDVHVELGKAREEESVAGLPPVTRLPISWTAERGTAFFPIMRADLSFWPLTSDETQLELEGTYRPPLGLLGGTVDALVGHRIAEAAVHRFVRELAEQLEKLAS
jgi:hypothetical protein